MNLHDILNGIPDLSDAACKNMGRDGDLFFDLNTGGRGGVIEEVKQLCGSCPERIKCLDYAVRNREMWGSWGGVSFQGGRR